MNDYEKSIQAIKDYDTKLSVKEWNRIAKEYNYLSAKTLTRLANKRFAKLVDETRKKV